MASRELQKIKAHELEVVKKYLRTKPVKLGAMASELGLNVLVAALEPGISGMIESSGNTYTIKINRHETRERQRFTLAHEIAHFLLHRHLIDSEGSIRDTVLYRSGQAEQVEFEANRLAADLVMPDGPLREDLSKIKSPLTDEVLDFLARQWQVSKSAMEIKLGPVMA